MAVGVTTAARAGNAAVARYLAREEGSRPWSQSAVPVWVHRMHADGLSRSGVSGRAPLTTGSQRFIDRWNRAVGGY